MTTVRREMEIALIKSYTEKPWRSPETYQMIEESLREKWEVCSIHPQSTQDLRDYLDRQKQQYGDALFVFNIAEYLDEEAKEGFLPTLLEVWNLPHLGSSAETVALGLDKAKTKAAILIISHNKELSKYIKVDNTYTIKNGEINLIINTPIGKGPKFDEYHIRREATIHKVPIITTIPGALAGVRAIEALKKEEIHVKPIQEYHETVYQENRLRF